MSITGGKEHGVPILISEIHEGQPADRCNGLYIGDAILSVNGIDLRQAKHAEAVDILSRQTGEIILEVQFVAPETDSDDEDEEEEYIDEATGVRYHVYRGDDQEQEEEAMSETSGDINNQHFNGNVASTPPLHDGKALVQHDVPSTLNVKPVLEKHPNSMSTQTPAETCEPLSVGQLATNALQLNPESTESGKELFTGQ
ncbi:Golgi-associated PDZ and coiled-coil motif-containing protein-like [Saccoglossus kowalevskii]|uniref:Golgi-associated PDZ and coiled-coil motif-containing protein-like n=1 Tax=Saccoglossus kowalevskii TaxID=10224 RepID=A0ABM0GQH2_SACKO|nr:PREDICTED: golgi-associated PDZ and coiled-coil motif-containing protein-like [Saccoglossus kowalevskii]